MGASNGTRHCPWDERVADIKRGRSRIAVTSQLENEASARFDGLEFKNGPRRGALIVPLLAQPERHSPRWPACEIPHPLSFYT